MFTIDVIGPTSGERVYLIGSFHSETEAEKAIKANRPMFFGFTTRVVQRTADMNPVDPHTFPR